MNLETRIEKALECIQHGWCSPSKAKTLAAAVKALRPATVVEIGTYAGRSFVPMALALQEIGKGKAIGIDPYDAEVSASTEVGANKAWWGAVDHTEIEAQFRVVVTALELDPFVDIMKARSDDVQPPDGIGLLHVDGAHTEQALRDVQRFAQNVDIGGLVCLDDILWDSGMVNQAAMHLLTLGFVELYRVVGMEGTWYNNWAMFSRIDWSAP
jgi:predicted O-methyltransferase YrrM